MTGFGSSRQWLPAIGLAAAYVFAGLLGLSLGIAHGSATPVWPPTGIALAALLLFGRRLWPAITVGAFAVNLLTSAAPQRGFDELLGRGLAELHRFGAPRFGLDHDNFIGSLPQRNAEHATWAEFFWSERLEPQLQRAIASGLATARLRAGFERWLDAANFDATERQRRSLRECRSAT